MDCKGIRKVQESEAPFLLADQQLYMQHGQKDRILD